MYYSDVTPTDCFCLPIPTTLVVQIHQSARCVCVSVCVCVCLYVCLCVWSQRWIQTIGLAACTSGRKMWRARRQGVDGWGMGMDIPPQPTRGSGKSRKPRPKLNLVKYECQRSHLVACISLNFMLVVKEDKNAHTTCRPGLQFTFLSKEWTQQQWLIAVHTHK